MSNNELTAKIRELKQLQALMVENNTEEMMVDVYKVRYTTVKSSRFDSTAFKKTHADLYAQYSKQTETRRFSVA